MNLHSIVSPYVGAVNPLQTVTIQSSGAPTVNPDFSRTPTYTTFTMQAQIQALQFNDIAQLEGLNIQGLRRAIYLYGNWNGLVRGAQKGGDKIIFPDGSIWLVVFVFETWGHGELGSTGWCKVAVTVQDGP